MKRALILLFVFSVFGTVVAGGPNNETPKAPKTKSIIMLSGKIYDNGNNELLAGVKIVCSNCSKTFYSDLDGRFFITLEAETTADLKLEFSQVGYSSRSLDVKELQTISDNISIDLQSE
ncbi:MAG: carboxypeptidase-like regulatory domain-containing protein [Bacteroidia bacterium]